jgi:hypothetical protein
MLSIIFRLRSKALRILNRTFVRPANYLRISPLAVLCKDFGSSRGAPLDRILIQDFLMKNCSNIQRVGTVLEFGDNEYSKMFFPSANSVTLLYESQKPLGFRSPNILVGDLLEKPSVSRCFDLVISTQFLAFTANPFVALENLSLLLRPGGIIIGTEPFLSPISTYDSDRWGDYFRMTRQGLSSVVSHTKELELTRLEHLGGQVISLGLLHGYCSQDFKRFPGDTSDNFPTLHGYVCRKFPV